MTDKHDEKETLSVDVIIPGHEDRTETALFKKTRKMLLGLGDNRCFICGQKPDQCGPLEAHHSPIERSLANCVDWSLIVRDAQDGVLGFDERQRRAIQNGFDWKDFVAGTQHVPVPEFKDPATGLVYPAGTYLKVVDPYKFVDDMTVNGILLCKHHHTGKDQGIHMMPHPLWLIQRYAHNGYRISPQEVIKHASD